MFLEGANNPSNRAHVDNLGNLNARAVATSEQDEASVNGDAYNINTGNLTLTSAAETPLFFLKNESEARDLKLTRLFVTFLNSTGGAGGPISGLIYRNPTGGTILTASDLAAENFNFGQSKTLGAIVKVGATGLTVVGTQTPVKFLFTDDLQRHLIPFESIILPRGASLVFAITPPAGNTSMIVQAGCNVHLAQGVRD